ncbi:hypothetical protein KKC97_10470 [bacterium]|nr:hypothetical protein [bacterium]MBU1638075.1 hypothetical protein [bacterium]
MDLDTLKKFSAGELGHKKFIEVHEEARELLDLLYQNLAQAEYVVSVQDWHEPKRTKKLSQFIVLKTMMLFTPFVIVVGTAITSKDLHAGLIILGLWLALCGLSSVYLLIKRSHILKSKEGKSVLVITNRRMMRVWLDGSEAVQAWRLGIGHRKKKAIDPVPETIKLLLELDLGQPSDN